MTSPAIKRLWSHLSTYRKKQMTLLFLGMGLTSFTEIITIGAVLPFLGALMSPNELFESVYLRQVIAYFEITEPNQLLFPLTLIFIGATAVAAVMRLSLLWAQTRLGHAIGADLSIQIYEKTLYQPYSVHASRNSSEVIAGILSKVNIVVGNTLLPLLMVTSSLFLLAGILGALIALNPLVAFVTFFVFAFVYSLVMVLSKNQLTQNGVRISKEYGRMLKALQEGLGGIRDVLIDGTQAAFCKIYQSADMPLRKAQADNQIIATFPRFLIEALGIAMIATLAYLLALSDGGASTAIPLLGALALGAQRLLPILQQLFSSWSSLRGGQASLQDVLDLIEQPLPFHASNLNWVPTPFKKSIKLVNINFRYSDQTPWILKKINLEIPKGARIGITGTTGSGKSTLLDIFMALLYPNSGNLLVDETLINEQNFRAWQSHIAHVPQSIFLADASVAENIAFGVPLDQIDFHLVKKAAEQAQISTTIESLENGYYSTVGERGVRLSGGQRQRIGVARAFYKRADVIVFDEATSSLDNNTETNLMRSIDNLGFGITVLIIAHRISTLKNCDRIIEISEGVIKFNGTYEEMINRGV